MESPQFGPFLCGAEQTLDGMEGTTVGVVSRSHDEIGDRRADRAHRSRHCRERVVEGEFRPTYARREARWRPPCQRASPCPENPAQPKVQVLRSLSVPAGFPRDRRAPPCWEGCSERVIPTATGGPGGMARTRAGSPLSQAPAHFGVRGTLAYGEVYGARPWEMLLGEISGAPRRFWVRHDARSLAGSAAETPGRSCHTPWQRASTQRAERTSSVPTTWAIAPPDVATGASGLHHSTHRGVGREPRAS